MLQYNTYMKSHIINEYENATKICSKENILMFISALKIKEFESITIKDFFTKVKQFIKNKDNKFNCYHIYYKLIDMLIEIFISEVKYDTRLYKTVVYNFEFNVPTSTPKKSTMQSQIHMFNNTFKFIILKF